MHDQHGTQSFLDYDELVVGTGAVPVRGPIDGLNRLGVEDGVHLLHSMGDTFDLTASLDGLRPATALIVGAGYVGLEMAEGLTARGIHVTQVEMLPEVLPTVDVELGALVHTELAKHGVDVHTNSTVTRITRTPDGPARLHVEGTGPDGEPLGWDVDLASADGRAETTSASQSSHSRSPRLASITSNREARRDDRPDMWRACCSRTTCSWRTSRPRPQAPKTFTRLTASATTSRPT
jgi:pyruvate/2-oxoglutarate dehydrogenase complex dihydrolipoamide dehydrogenase (E3) component